ncbi:MAG TPA: ATP-binding protein [Bacteroidales bacterium]|jgi:serine/threonine-protein kinase RsbW|nr:ATP-binding protein [Bacteroidales bacterium]MDI9534259.1 ATP-binding protein [Bacteroidota bacterium]MBK7732733.1 ATP-binding protein [Bacteroidales bacterium]MBP7035949.1 ATP-binding protein [Bacteroidales bacterium]MBP8709174.1 ATP-binding protein [Bacteroidales bacterium]
MESITINSNIENLRAVEAQVDKLSKKLGISDEVYGKILISTVEAVNNAILHGNKGIETKTVKVDFIADGTVFEVTVTDQGEGFDYNHLPDPTDPANIENLHGRGVFIMRSLADNIEYNPSGNQVRMKFKY